MKHWRSEALAKLCVGVTLVLRSDAYPDKKPKSEIADLNFLRCIKINITSASEFHVLNIISNFFVESVIHAFVFKFFLEKTFFDFLWFHLLNEIYICDIFS